MNLDFDELLQYTSDERQKWRDWLVAHPSAIDAPVQPGGQLSTVGKLIDHIVLAERRFLQRLTGEPLSDTTGLTGNNAPPLFDYGASVRRELEQLVSMIDEAEAYEPRPMVVRDHTYQVTPRNVLFHLLVHEIRHWAQIALAVRLAGFDPPGQHDLFFSKAMK